MTGAWIMAVGFGIMVIGFLLNFEPFAYASIAVIFIGGIVLLIETWRGE